MQSNDAKLMAMAAGHPSKINLSPVPPSHDRSQINDRFPEQATAVPDGPEPSVKGVLRALAVEFQAAMECEAESFIRSCRRMDGKRIAMCPGRYDAYLDAYGTIRTLWDSFEFDGPPQPKQVWHTLQGHANAIVQEMGKDTAF